MMEQPIKHQEQQPIRIDRALQRLNELSSRLAQVMDEVSTNVQAIRNKYSQPNSQQ